MIVNLPYAYEEDGVVTETIKDVALQVNGAVGFTVFGNKSFRGIVYGEILEIDEELEAVRVKCDTGDEGWINKQWIKSYMPASTYATFLGAKMMQPGVDKYFEGKNHGEITND